MIITLTSWPARIKNLPTVLDTVKNQCDKIVVNLSELEFANRELPYEVSDYIYLNNIEIIWHKDNTRVWKKLFPTLLKYPNELVMPIDDDIIYPYNVVEVLFKKHLEYPNHPISGNHVRIGGVQYHCGCCSLVESKYYEGYFNVDERIMKAGASDVYYTQSALKNGYTYISTDRDYMITSERFNETCPYSANLGGRLVVNTINICKQIL